MQRNNTRPERMNLLADVAELYYIQGEDQAQIAKRLNLFQLCIYFIGHNFFGFFGNFKFIAM